MKWAFLVVKCIVMEMHRKYTEYIREKSNLWSRRIVLFRKRGEMEEMRSTKERMQPRWWMGVLWFVVVMAVVIFAFGPIQNALGMPGLVVTELILLAMAVIPAIVMKWDLKEVFSIRLPKIRQIFGALFIWAGAFLLMMSVNMIIMYLFPQQMANTGTALNSFFTSISPVIGFLILAVSPAICEEALCRGLIQYTFRDVKSKFIVVAAIGVIFGIFHLDPVRILGTGILGAAIAYVMLETKNILLPMLIHFTNNALSAVATFSTANQTVSEEAMAESVELLSSSTAFIGVYVMLAAAAPVLLLIGAAMIRVKKTENEAVVAEVQEETEVEPVEAQTAEVNVAAPMQRPVPVKRPEGFITIRKILVAFICSAVLGVAGFGLVVYGVLAGSANFNTYEIYEMLGMEEEAKNSPSFSYFDISNYATVTEDTSEYCSVGVSDDGEFTLHISVEGGNEDCLCSVKLIDANDMVVYESGAGADMTLTTIEPLVLTKGEYMVEFEYSCTEGVEVNEEFACRVRLTKYRNQE